ncbi:TerB family tellurite resistance protein [Antarcticibacterium arcticum]|uniref:TerB family tellurite resistance protein n=1 Tax=Antarcticibacterium arcticum TaxID=2585771 RepID=A0A5B8YL90_9FLAO|nr:TerB family tellurite resistance protein [Antarcticibacterium arcticum]QED38682.1 TerB family tellurite resistance protein [Antarcticibacterium arcticum]
MSFSDLYGSGEHVRNLGHFAAIVNMAAIDGEISQREEKLLRRFASKLDISDEEYIKVVDNPNAYPIHPPNSYERRLSTLHDLFVIIFANHEMDEDEAHLLKRYAIGLGFSQEQSEKIITRSIQIFSGELDFEDYKYLLTR